MPLFLLLANSGMRGIFIWRKIRSNLQKEVYYGLEPAFFFITAERAPSKLN